MMTASKWGLTWDSRCVPCALVCLMTALPVGSCGVGPNVTLVPPAQPLRRWSTVYIVSTSRIDPCLIEVNDSTNTRVAVGRRDLLTESGPDSTTEASFRAALTEIGFQVVTDSLAAGAIVELVTSRPCYEETRSLGYVTRRRGIPEIQARFRLPNSSEMAALYRAQSVPVLLQAIEHDY